MKFRKTLVYFSLLIMIIIPCLSSCIDSNDAIYVCWECVQNDKVEAQMPVLLDTKEQIIGKAYTVIDAGEIKNLYDSMHYILSDNQYRELCTLLSDAKMKRILSAGGHYSCSDVAVSPVSTYRLTVYCGDSQQVITYDSSISASDGSDLECLYNLHMFLYETVIHADGYDELLSEYDGLTSPFD